MKWKLILFLLIGIFGWSQDPEAYYLTWKDNPSHSMIIFWISKDKQTIISFQKSKEDNWVKKQGEVEFLTNSSLLVHKVELTDLEEDTDYQFRINSSEEIHRFHTLPKDFKRPLKIAIGGDVFLDEKLYSKMNREVAKNDPDFAILGGDLAYSEGMRRFLKPKSWKAQRWFEFFKIWTRDMVTKEGRIIPLVPVIGNHDIRGGLEHPLKQDILFYQLFSFPQNGIPYRTLEIGENLCFFLLDTGHSYPVGGGQTEWLEKSLLKHENALYKIPVYHIAAYPSVASFNYCVAPEIRKFWVPLFEKFRLQIVMENDNHAFKRTFPLIQGKIDEKGVSYLGDGNWGVPPRNVKSRYYLKKALKTTCYWLLTISQEECHCQAFDNDGTLLDDLTVIPNEQKMISK